MLSSVLPDQVDTSSCRCRQAEPVEDLEVPDHLADQPPPVRLGTRRGSPRRKITLEPPGETPCAAAVGPRAHPFDDGEPLARMVRRGEIALYRPVGVDFADAVIALEDALAATVPDPDSRGEDRIQRVGTEALGRLLVVSYSWRGEDLRVISARQATPRERRQYEGS